MSGLSPRPNPLEIHQASNHLVQRQPSPLLRPSLEGYTPTELLPHSHEHTSITITDGLSPTTNNTRNSEATTPLPYLKILPLMVQRVSEGLCYAVIFPYINEMVFSMGVEEKSVGVWSSIAESTMMATEAMAAPLYGPLADKYGRRPILLTLEVLWGLFGVLFGFSKTVWMVIFLRACLGLLAGCGVISRTMVGELCDRSNRIAGFALFSPAITVGMTLAPLVGGFLSNPVPRLLSPSRTVFADHPYLLPAVVTGLSTVIAAAMSVVLLPETLQRSHEGNRSSRDQEKARGSRLGDLIRYPKFRSVLLLYGMHNATMFTWEGVYPLFAFTSKSLGGLGLSTQTIGVVLGLSACLSILMTIFVFPLVHRILSENTCLHMSLLSYIAGVLMFPVLWAMSYPHQGDGLPLSVWMVMSVQMVLRRLGDFATTQLDTLVFDAIPGPEHLASANSMMFSLAAIGRATGPFVISYFFSLSTRFTSPFSPGRQIVWIVFIVLCLPSLYLAHKLTQQMHHDQRKESRGDADESLELMGNRREVDIGEDDPV